MIIEGSFDTRFGDFYYYTAGKSEKTIVFFPGWFGDLKVIRPMANFFISKGYRIAAPCPPGYGKTFCPSRNFSFQDLCSVTEAFLEKVCTSHNYFLGYSLGGAVGWQMANVANSKLKKVILVDPAFCPYTKADIISKLRPLIKSYLHHRTSPQEILLIESSLKASLAKAHWSQLLNLVHELETLRVDKEWTRETGSLLFVWGHDDDLVPREKSLSQIEIPKGTGLIEFPGDHFWHSTSLVRLFSIALDFFEDKNGTISELGKWSSLVDHPASFQFIHQ